MIDSKSLFSDQNVWSAYLAPFFSRLLWSQGSISLPGRRWSHSESAKRGEVLFYSKPLSCFRCHGGFDFSHGTDFEGRLTREERNDLIAFLESLTDEEVTHDPKFANRWAERKQRWLGRAGLILPV